MGKERGESREEVQSACAWGRGRGWGGVGVRGRGVRAESGAGPRQAQRKPASAATLQILLLPHCQQGYQRTVSSLHTATSHEGEDGNHNAACHFSRLGDMASRGQQGGRQECLPVTPLHCYSMVLGRCCNDRTTLLKFSNHNNSLLQDIREQRPAS